MDVVAIDKKIKKPKARVLIGITGGIAAYKIPLLVRLLVQHQYKVKIIMTDAAKRFVTPETLSVLSKHPVYNSFFNENREWNNHIHLADWADIFVIAPATAHTLAKIAHGFSDNLLLLTYLSFPKTVLIAPAMDAEMWEHQTVQQNIECIKAKKNHYVLPVEYGELASGIKGWGRMMEPLDIFHHIQKHIALSSQFKNKKVLITAGATYEPIDPVRFIGNRSSGKTGIAIAEEFATRGAEVYLVHGYTNVPLPKHSSIHCIFADTAESMYQHCCHLFQLVDIAILAAAVADYTIVQPSVQKIKKQDEWTLHLKKTNDILKTLGAIKQTHQLLVGFALETENVIENARQKLLSKNADILFANICSAENPAFNADENELFLLNTHGEVKLLGKHKKHILAEKIVEELAHALKEKNKLYRHKKHTKNRMLLPYLNPQFKSSKF